MSTNQAFGKVSLAEIGKDSTQKYLYRHWIKMKEFDIKIYSFRFSDGKYHVLPSGDLHILRVDETDTGVPFSCLVLNTLTSNEESSPPFHVTVDSKYNNILILKVFFFVLKNLLNFVLNVQNVKFLSNILDGLQVRLNFSMLFKNKSNCRFKIFFVR